MVRFKDGDECEITTRRSEYGMTWSMTRPYDLEMARIKKQLKRIMRKLNV